MFIEAKIVLSFPGCGANAGYSPEKIGCHCFDGFVGNPNIKCIGR